MSFLHDPNAVLDYRVDWTQWLDSGETITAATWIVPDGLTSSSESFDSVSATVWLAGGTVGQTYTVTNRVTTTAGRTDDRSFRVRVVNR